VTTPRETEADASLTADFFVSRHPSADTRPEWRLVAEAALFGSARGVYFALRRVANLAAG